MELPTINQNDRNIIVSGESAVAVTMPARKKEARPLSLEQKPVVDLWPAYASGNIIGPEHAALAKGVVPPRLITIEASNTQNESRRKPRFLEELENFVSRELKAIGNVKDDRARDLKLQIYREVFEVLIEDFRAYRGLLASIKNEYELMIAYLRQRIRDLEPLQQLMTTQAAQFEQKLLEKEQAENEEIEHLKAENRKLRQRIANFKQDESAWQEQIRRMQEDLAAEYQRYRDECDARKLLIADINDLRYQQEEAHQQALLATKNKGEGIEEDLDLLKIALKEAKKAEAEATRKLDKMIADYADVVPRRDFERLEKDHEKAREQLETASRDYEILHGEHRQLLDAYNELKTESKALAKEYEEHKGMSTPRPKWNKAAGIIYGGAVKWQRLSEGKTSDQLLDVLIEELKKSGGFSDETTQLYFNALGNELTVPVYLRTSGKIKNRRLGRRDLLFEINSIWKERTEAGPEDRRSQHLDDFFFQYLRQKTLSDSMVYEWGYNIHMACQRHHDDERAKLFFGIVTGQVDEELYHYQHYLVEKIKSKLESADTTSEGGLTADTMRWALAELFPDKNDQRLDGLIRAAKLQIDWQEGEKIAYSELFKEDDEGGCGIFVDEVNDQITVEREEYVESIMQNTNGKSLLDASQLAEAVRTTDQQIPDGYVDRYCCWAFSTSADELDNSPALSAQDIRERLLNGCIFRIGRSSVSP